MKFRLILICAVVAISLSLFACTSKEESLEISCDEFMENHHISKGVEVGVDDSFTLTLCSSPSTGFQWVEEAQISNAGVLKQEQHKFISPEDDPPPPPGTPGQQVWIFKALKKGTSTISMEYSRPWEGGEKGEWTFTLNVTVK